MTKELVFDHPTNDREEIDSMMEWYCEDHWDQMMEFWDFEDIWGKKITAGMGDSITMGFPKEIREEIKTLLAQKGYAVLPYRYGDKRGYIEISWSRNASDNECSIELWRLDAEDNRWGSDGTTSEEAVYNLETDIARMW